MLKAMKNEEEFKRSPYLEEHNSDPVRWNLWGEEAFSLAKREDKPLFITIGYSTCHWCHVMQRESFQDEEISKILNEEYVPVVVDREERPDVDSFYMGVSQMMNGSGGWPLNVIAMPDGRPFQVFTYLPAREPGGNGGMEGILKAISEIWKSERGRIIEAADQISSIILSPEKAVEGEIGLDEAVQTLQSIYDRKNGGFGDQPKFPNFPYILFLMNYMHAKRTRNISYIVEKTLRNMRNGGIFDQIGYGFHRYSTDAEWKVPHFEKMLYDQAMAIQTYTQYYRLSGDRAFLEIAGEVADFVKREMRTSDGLYLSGLDADFNGSEGEYYTWTDQQLSESFDAEARKMIEESYYLDRDPENRIVLRRREIFNVSPEKVKVLRELNRKMLQVREKRGSPKRDDKAILCWNSMLLSSLLSYSVSNHKEGFDEIIATSEKLMKMFSGDGVMYRTVRDGMRGVEALLEDYAYYSSLMIDLYEFTGEKRYLSEAIEKTNTIRERFFDANGGGFFTSSEGKFRGVFKNRDRLDIIYPSGESVLFMVLEKLYLITGVEDFRELSNSILQSRRNEIIRNPLSSVFMLSSVMFKGRLKKIEVPPEMMKEFLDRVGMKFFPNVISVPGEGRLQICDEKSCQYSGSSLDDAMEFLSRREN